MATNYIGDPFYEEEEFQTFQQPQHFNLNDYPYRGPVQSGYTNTGNIVGYPGEAGYDDNLSFERDFRNNRLSDTGVQMAYKTPRTIADQNRVLGMTLAEDEDPKGLRALFQNLDPSEWGTALKNKASTGWDFAKQIPGMAMGALGGMPGVAMNLLSKLGKPDTPYQKFQKQMFEDMGWQGESNKDPWGKNINSAFGDYDVTEQWGDLMGSKLGQKYGYADAMADGVLDDAELAKMQDLGLKGWQLNRAIGLSTAAKKAKAWQEKKAQEKIITNQMKNIDTGGGKTTTYTPTGNYGATQGTKGSWTPGGTYQGNKKSSSKGYQQKQGSHHYIRGGRVGYADGGLATLFTRRG